jgi:DNA repair exonuclease SbcCD ATPase subunit
MHKDVYDNNKPLGLGVALGFMSNLVGVLFLPGIDYGDLNRFTSTATNYTKSLTFFIIGTILLILGTGFLLHKLRTVEKKARRFDEVKQKLEKLELEGKHSEVLNEERVQKIEQLNLEAKRSEALKDEMRRKIEKLELEAKHRELLVDEVRAKIESKRQDVEHRSLEAREHLRLFQEYLSLLVRIRRKAKVEPSDVAAAKEVCARVGDDWGKRDRTGIFSPFYAMSHEMWPIRVKLEDGLENLIGNDGREVVEFCNSMYESIDVLKRKMQEELAKIENKLFSADYASLPDSGQSPH